MKKNKYLITIIIGFSLLFISLLIISSNSIENFQATTPITQVYDIIIVAGQSNAVGYGFRNACDISNSLPGCTTSADKIRNNNNSTRNGAITNIANSYDSTNPRIKQFSGENAAVEANRNKIIDMREPLNYFEVRDAVAKVSFAFQFAKEYLSRTTNMGSRQVLIVGCGWPAASMRPLGDIDFSRQLRRFWRKPIATDNVSLSLYNKTSQRLRNVKNRLSSTNSSKVVAFLWHQGETNMSQILSSSANKTLYKSDLKESLTGMRTEIMSIFNNNNSGYRYPILLGGLSLDQSENRVTRRRLTGNNKEMSQLISEVSNPTDPNYIEKSAFVSSDSLPNVGQPIYDFNRRLEGNSIMDLSGNIINTDDNTHFSATSYREFGKRYFYYYNLIK